MSWHLLFVVAGILLCIGFIAFFARDLWGEKFYSVIECMRFRSLNPFNNSGKLNTTTFESEFERAHSECRFVSADRMKHLVATYQNEFSDEHWKQIRYLVLDSVNFGKSVYFLSLLPQGELRDEAQDELIRRTPAYFMRMKFEHAVNSRKFSWDDNDYFTCTINPVRAIFVLLESGIPAKIDLGDFLVENNFGDIQKHLTPDEHAAFHSGVVL